MLGRVMALFAALLIGGTTVGGPIAAFLADFADPGRRSSSAPWPRSRRLGLAEDQSLGPLDMQVATCLSSIGERPVQSARRRHAEKDPR
jgi:hypothetical protein